ncbi:hypothetical protein MHM98_14520 [Psychrobium sp. MM17-31]|uniref:hypothetical protein n=1 Tax=Psychrobium sp. MM17-31 TaxID=2917758 RepID=UPI001EF5FA29|nr:hypothetical protein [Psychrobium sp. MM17-31]MCG7532550.1 hypothetical protein [Psychrobium sp. MM17-31]
MIKTNITRSLLASLLVLTAHNASANNHINQQFKDYWYAGDAELSSYKLQQARYGELNEGTATLIYVTEQFLPKEQVKADSVKDTNIGVLKLNKHKSFLTGIYPYTIMTSTFSPTDNQGHAIKVSNTTQEWCGNAYAQLNNRGLFEVSSHSYFEGEADKNFTLNKALLEDELWTKIRLNPTSLPQGEVQLIPALEYSRLLHIDTKAYPAKLSLNKGDKTSVYNIKYPTLNRTLAITFNNEFPYVIQGWEDTYKSGFGESAKVLTSSATLIATIKEKYWQQHNNKHRKLRKKLGL